MTDGPLRRPELAGRGGCAWGCALDRERRRRRIWRAARHSAVEDREGGQRGGSQVHASPARALQSGELKNDDHQNDDHQHTDNGADNSPVHGQNLLSRHWVPAYCWCKTCGRLVEARSHGLQPSTPSPALMPPYTTAAAMKGSSRTCRVDRNVSNNRRSGSDADVLHPGVRLTLPRAGACLRQPGPLGPPRPGGAGDAPGGPRRTP
jgi:hypothetical protein